MEVSTACQLVNDLVFFPEVKLSADDHTNRFEGSIKVRIDYWAINTNKDKAPHYNEWIETYATFAVVVHDCNDALSLYRKILNAWGMIQAHEAREALRVRSTLWAPFHPHRIDGMKAWNATADTCDDTSLFGDLQFGLA
jgi:hypothetical protein